MASLAHPVEVSATTSLVLPFDSPDATLAVVGGKGANLSRMTRAAFLVPPGFFITTDAYRAFVQAKKPAGGWPRRASWPRPRRCSISNATSCGRRPRCHPNS